MKTIRPKARGKPRREYTEVFFNRPTAAFPKKRLIDDIDHARQRLAVASAWFTDHEIAGAACASQAKEIIVIRAHSDLKREGAGAVSDMLTRASRHRGFNLVCLGSTDFREGIMHHKFVVTEKVVWVGSYNFTYQAARNYETLIRIPSVRMAALFWQEAVRLAGDQALWTGGVQFTSGPSGFRCGRCELVKGWEHAANSQMDSVVYCKGCLKP